MKKMTGRGKWILLALAAILLLAMLPFVTQISAEDILSFTPQNPWLAAGVILALFAAKNIVMVFPAMALYIAAGIMFPVGWGVVLCYVGLWLEFTIGYLVGCRLGDKRVREQIEKRPRAGTFFRLIERNRKTACFLARLVPLPVPLDLMSMFFGATGVPYKVYIFFSLLGVSGPMIPCVIAGESAHDPLSPGFLVPFAVSVGISGGVLALNLLLERYRRKKNP